MGWSGRSSITSTTCWRWIHGRRQTSQSPPVERQEGGPQLRLGSHLKNADIVSMPGQVGVPPGMRRGILGVPLRCRSRSSNPEFAKGATGCCSSKTVTWHPNGQLPAYEWKLQTINQPAGPTPRALLVRLPRQAARVQGQSGSTNFPRTLLPQADAQTSTWWVKPQGCLRPKTSLPRGGFPSGPR